MVKAVVFDLDDTLIAENQFIESGFMLISKTYSERLGLDLKYLYNILIGLFKEDTKNVFNRLFNFLNIDYSEDNIRELIELYRNHMPNIKFFDDVNPILNILREKKIKLGIITDGYANTQRNKLEVLGAYNLFDKIIITDEIGREYWKPHPMSFEIMKNDFNIEFSEMLYVGDNPEKDFYIKSFYPIKTVRIIRNGIYKDKKYLNNVRETYLISNLNEIIELLN